MTFDADVEVVWTYDGSPARGDVGARRIVRGARDADADLLVMVGETGALTPDRAMRLERFARNRCGGGRDNLGFSGAAGWIPPTRARRSSRTGDFICNESFHTALREARDGVDGRAASGRWVQFVHVAADGDPALLAGSLARVIATYVEEMTWATDAWDRSAEPAHPRDDR